MLYVQHPLRLEGKNVTLVPLEPSHFENLAAMSREKEIWKYLAVDGSDEQSLMTSLKSALLMRARGEQYPLTVFNTAENKIIGSTRLYNIYPEHRKLEIGWTWYLPEYWGKGLNTECKYLLLKYCFEQLAALRVQLQTNELNARSRAAIEKIGAVHEGILRNDRINTDGTSRNTAIYSIIAGEWPRIKKMLEDRMRTI